MLSTSFYNLLIRLDLDPNFTINISSFQGLNTFLDIATNNELVENYKI
jgi:hypothetical protein